MAVYIYNYFYINEWRDISLRIAHCHQEELGWNHPHSPEMKCFLLSAVSWVKPALHLWMCWSKLGVWHWTERRLKHGLTYRLDFTSSGALEQGFWSLPSSLVGCRVRQHKEGDKVWHQLIVCTPGVHHDPSCKDLPQTNYSPHLMDFCFDHFISFQ